MCNENVSYIPEEPANGIIEEHVDDGRIVLDEEDDSFKTIKEEWYAEAENCTEETFPEFMRHILHDYHHDYGTICHAITALIVGAGKAANKSDEGGITGLQASFIMWGFIREWMYTDNKCGLRLIDFDDMLYPQYEYKFNSRTIGSTRWENLQSRAKELLEETESKGESVCKEVKDHWQSIIDGTVPFGWEVSDER